MDVNLDRKIDLEDGLVFLSHLGTGFKGLVGKTASVDILSKPQDLLVRNRYFGNRRQIFRTIIEIPVTS